MRGFYVRKEGGIVLEAALLLPLALAFLLALIQLIHVCRTELVLRAATNEAVKSLAAGIYPLALLLRETQDSPPATSFEERARRVQAARAQALQADRFATGYEAYLTDELLQLWQMELAQQGTDEVLPQNLAAFTPLVYAYCNRNVIQPNQFQVVGYMLPDVTGGKQPYLMIEAEVRFELRVPFFSRTFTLKKRAIERAWTGA